MKESSEGFGAGDRTDAKDAAATRGDSRGRPGRGRGGPLGWGRVLGGLGLVLALSLGTSTDARAEDDHDVMRLSGATGAVKWNHVLPGRAERYGHAEVLVHAPVGVVRQLVTDYAHYKEFAPHKFQNSRIVAKRAGETDVYLQIPIMNGSVTLWDVTRFAPARSTGPGVEVVEGRQVKGNLRDLHVIWTLREVDPEFTVLKCDLLLALNVSAPQAAVDEELRDAAAQAVESVWVRAQKGERRVVPFVRSAAAAR